MKKKSADLRGKLTALHSRMGDFWWYSLMLFIACRFADVLNAFVGLWLVPKYVPPSELGAVMPLANFAAFFALPMAVSASTFRNELSNLALRREIGKLKTLIRGVFIASGVFLFCAIIVARFILPHFLERIRIAEGALGLLILVSSFVGAVSPIYANTLQALRKFRETSLINLVGAPIRLVTMLVAMPFRPLAGYFVGQISTPVFTIGASVFSLRKELAVPAEPYWTRDVLRRFGRLFLIFSAGGIVGSFSLLVETTVLRQRLPDIESAAYYMVTRFSDIASFLYCTLSFTLFPFTAELAAKGKDMRHLIFKASAATVAFSGAIALVFAFFGKPILAFLPHGDAYAAYWWAIPWLIGIGTMGAVTNYYSTAEMSANRFGYMKWMVPLNILYPVALLIVTGHGYFTGILPASALALLKSLNATSLQAMLWWQTAIAALRLTGVAVALFTRDGAEVTRDRATQHAAAH